MLSPRLKRLLFFAFGGIFGLFLHLTLVSRVLDVWLTSSSSLSSSLSAELDRGVFWLLIFILSILSTFSRQVRCTLFLCFPTLFATQSRRFLFMLILTTLVQDGPLDTIGMNTFNVIQSIKCQARNQLVMAERQMELLFNPVQQILERMVQNQDKISSIGTHVSNDVIGFRPEYQRAVKDRLLDKLKEKRNQEKNPKAVKSLDEKIEKLENSTGAIDPVNQVSRMRKLYDSALILTGDLGPANEFVNPVKAEQSLHEAKSISCTGFTKSFRDLGDIICDDPEFREELAMSPNLQDRGTVCSYSPVSKDKSIKQISPKYSLRLSSMPHVYTKRVSIRHVCQGEQYKPDLNGKSFRGLYDQYVDEVKNLSDITKDQKFSFRIRPKIPSFHIDSQLGKEFKRLYQQRKKYLDALKVFWDMFISFIIMMVLISAWKYHNKYLTDVTFDNIYISGYFRHIDDRRKRAGKSFKLLPIKKLDGRPELINALSLKLNSEEARQMKASFTLLIAFCFVVATVIYVDILLSTIIESYSRHMAFTVVQKGFNSVKFFVTGHPSGDGPIARAFKEAFDNFESEFNLDKPTDMKNCMPKAVFTPSSKITKIVVVLFVWVFLNLNSAYLLRIRRMTCSFFYRKREKQRILHLYNNMLSTRKKILRFKVSQAIEDKRKMLPTSSNPSLDGSNSVDLDGEECRLCQEILVDPVACSTCYSQAQGSEGVLISGSTNPTNTFYCRQCFDQLLRVCLICCSIEDFDEAFVVRK